MAGEQRRASGVCTQQTHQYLQQYTRYIFFDRGYVSVLVLLCTTNASDGGRAMYVHRNTAYVPGAALLLLSALNVDFLSLPTIVGIARAPPWADSAPDLAVGTWAWVRTRGNRRSPARRTRARRGTSESVWVSRCFCMCAQQIQQQRYSST